MKLELLVVVLVASAFAGCRSTSSDTGVAATADASTVGALEPAEANPVESASVLKPAAPAPVADSEEALPIQWMRREKISGTPKPPAPYEPGEKVEEPAPAPEPEKSPDSEKPPSEPVPEPAPQP